MCRASEDRRIDGRQVGDACPTGRGRRSTPRCRRRPHGFFAYTTSSIRWLDAGSPDSTQPAKRIQGLEASTGMTLLKERRGSSASEIPSRHASSLAAAYSSSGRLICVQIMITILTACGKSPPWPFSTNANPKKAKVFRGSLPPHPAADHFIHGLLGKELSCGNGEAVPVDVQRFKTTLPRRCPSGSYRPVPSSDGIDSFPTVLTATTSYPLVAAGSGRVKAISARGWVGVSL